MNRYRFHILGINPIFFFKIKQVLDSTLNKLSKTICRLLHLRFLNCMDIIEMISGHLGFSTFDNTLIIHLLKALPKLRLKQ